MGDVGPDFWAVSDQIDATIRDTKARLARLQARENSPRTATRDGGRPMTCLSANANTGDCVCGQHGPEVEALATTREVAEFLRLTENTMKTWRTRGQGPPWFTIEGTVRYRWADVEAWLDANKGAKL